MALTRKVKSGLTQAPFDTYIGEAGQIFFSNDTGEIRISDGVTPNGRPVYVAVTNANIGNLVITGSTIEALNTNEDLNLSTNGEGNVNVYGSFKVHTDGTGSTVSFDAAASGLITITAPNPVPSGSSGALNIVGSADGSFMPVTGAGGMIHITGNPDTLARVTIDGFLTSGSGPQNFSGATAGYGTIAMRAARGTPSSPLPVLKDDLIGNYSALGWVGSSSRYSPNQVAGLQFFAAETFTNASATGTYAQMRLAPAGTNAGVVSTTFFANGIVTGNVVASNVTVGNFTQTGNSIILGTRTITGNSTFVGTTTFTGTVTHTGDTTYDGNLTVQQGLTVVGTTTHQGNLDINGTLNVAGNEVITKQIIITAAGNIAFNDGTVQTTASIKQINNLDHITGALGFLGNLRTLNLSSDATSTNTAGTIVSRDGSGNIAVGNVTASTLNTTSVTANSSIAGSLTVYGNLNVVGTTVTTNAVVTTVDTKTFTIASNAASAIAADGAAFLVGNIAGASVADWTYDNAQAAWRSNVSVIPAASLNGQSLGSATREWNHLYAGEAYLSQKLNVGVVPMVEYLNVAQFTANVPQYSQVYNQNLSSNAGATTDFVAANDIGGESNNYIDIGINSSGYSEPAYSIQYANDGYVFINGGNLTVGTQSTGTDIVFHTDGTTANKEAGRVHLGRWILGGADNGVDKLQVTGTATISGNLVAGNVSATNLTNQFATLTANAATQANQITGANAAIVTANTAMKSYVDAVTTAWTANATTQQGQIATLQSQVYSNTNTAAYLTTATISTTGNITAGNVMATTLFHGSIVGVTGNFSGNVTASNLSVGNVTTTTGSTVLLAAGTATSAPLTLQSGTGLTSATAGAVEYDGTAFYSTPIAAQRGITASEQFYVTGADRSYTPGSGAQSSLLGVGVTLSGSTRYHFALKSTVSKAGGGGQALSVAFGGTATLSRLTYYYVTDSAASVTAGSVNQTSGFSTGTTVTPNTNAAVPVSIEIFGFIDVGVSGGGTVIPTIGWSATPGAVTVGAHSAMRIFPIGASGTGNTSIGNWA